MASFLVYSTRYMAKPSPYIAPLWKDVRLWVAGLALFVFLLTLLTVS